VLVNYFIVHVFFFFEEPCETAKDAYQI